MSNKYILDGHKAVEELDLFRWARWFESANRRVANERVGKSSVSTVFLGLDHSFGDGEPLLFETMVFGGKLDGAQDRYTTWDQAVKGHAKMVKKVRGSK